MSNSNMPSCMTCPFSHTHRWEDGSVQDVMCRRYPHESKKNEEHWCGEHPEIAALAAVAAAE